MREVRLRYRVEVVEWLNVEGIKYSIEEHSIFHHKEDAERLAEMQQELHGNNAVVVINEEEY